MDKKINKMKTEIKQQNNFYIAVTALCLIALGTDLSGILTSAYSDPHAANFVNGFILGLFIVVEVFVIMKFVKIRKLLKMKLLSSVSTTSTMTNVPSRLMQWLVRKVSKQLSLLLLQPD